MSCDQAPQHPKLPSRIWGLLQHFCPHMQGFVCLIGLIQPQALLYLLLGLVLAHLWCKAPHKIFIRLGHAISVRQQESRSLPCTVQTQRRSREDDLLRGRCQKAYQIPLSQLRLCWDGKETRSTKVKQRHTKTIITNRFVESWCIRKISSPLTIKCSKIVPQIPIWKTPEKHVSRWCASNDIPEYLLPPHPSKRNSQHPCVRPPPPSFYCWRYSRWPCHSRPCVPSGILSCPQQAVPRSL